MGEKVNAGQIREGLLYKYMSMIGADCECGLDRKWMLGKQIPLLWPSVSRQTLATNLGFDVDNPMLLSEMSMILAKETNPDLLGDVLPGELGENVRLAGKVARTDFNKRTTLTEAANTGAEAMGRSLINLNLMTQDIYDYAKHAAAATPLRSAHCRAAISAQIRVTHMIGLLARGATAGAVRPEYHRPCGEAPTGVEARRATGHCGPPSRK